MNPLRVRPQSIRIAGHRGHSSGAPENTLAAFRKAHQLAGTGVVCETDLAMTSDGELILIHDDTVDRTTNGRGLVRNMTYGEIAELDAGINLSEEFIGERVPRLEDALHLARELVITYQLELKIYDQNERIFENIGTLRERTGCADRLQFSSFDFVQLLALKEAFPDIPTVGLTHSRLIDPTGIAKEAKLNAMNLEIRHFPSGQAKQLHEAGFAVFLLVPPPMKLRELEMYGVDVESRVVGWVREGLLDQVISDDVGQVVAIVERARQLQDD